MDDARPSRTALSAARHRAVHQLLERGALFPDPLALPILSEPAPSLIRDARTHPGRRSMRWFICARSRLAEDVAAAAAGAGVEQLVILGAGLDTFGYRNPHPHLTVTEVDHPATQRWKLTMLRAAGIDPTPVRHRAVNFECDDLRSTLLEIIDSARPVLFWWLGVTPYLTQQAIAATLSILGGLRSAAVVLDHASPIADLAAPERRIHQQRRDRVAAVGEPWIAEYRPDEIAALARRCGFADTRCVHEMALIDRALGRPHTEPAGPSHLLVAARAWPPSALPTAPTSALISAPTPAPTGVPTAAHPTTSAGPATAPA